VDEVYADRAHRNGFSEVSSARRPAAMTMRASAVPRDLRDDAEPVDQSIRPP